MKVFLRSNSGLRNLNKFYKAECICYVEGGGVNYSLESIISYNNFTDNTRDISFWKNIFQSFTEFRNIKFKSVGSKTVLLKLSDKILNDNLKNSILCMDSEYDEISNRKIIHPNHIYTYGYSIENDLFNIDNIIYVLSSNLGYQITDIRELKLAFDYFLKNFQKYIHYDYYSFEKSIALLNRDKPNSNLKISANDYPLLNLELLEKMCKELEIPDYESKKALTVEKNCYGHLMEAYFMQTIRIYLAKNSTTTFSYNTIINQLIFNCVNTFNPYRKLFYKKSLSKIQLN